MELVYDAVSPVTFKYLLYTTYYDFMNGKETILLHYTVLSTLVV
jgi:hypothetical protein